MKKLLTLSLSFIIFAITYTNVFGFEHKQELPSQITKESWKFTDSEVKDILIAHLEADGQKITNKKGAYLRWNCNYFDFNTGEKTIVLYTTYKNTNQRVKKGKIDTEIICIIDESGSMEPIKNDAIGGLNTFIERQQKIKGNASLTLILFDTEFKVVHENELLSDIPLLDDTTYQPGGMTALLDAIGDTIDNVRARLLNTPEQNRPDKIIVAILTDGQENSSYQYDLSKVKKMISHQKDVYKWEFIFLGANQDAFAEAGELGIDSKDTFNFQPTPTGISDACLNLDTSVSGYRIDQDGNASTFSPANSPMAEENE